MEKDCAREKCLYELDHISLQMGYDKGYLSIFLQNNAFANSQREDTYLDDVFVY